MSDTAIEIAGTGPAGLAAAMILAYAGRLVIVHQTQAEFGYRVKRLLAPLARRRFKSRRTGQKLQLRELQLRLVPARLGIACVSALSIRHNGGTA